MFGPQVHFPHPAVDPRARNRPGPQVQRQRIVAAAIDVLGRQAVEDTTVADIIAQARMSRGTFYRCFDSLESVLDEIYGLWHAELTGAVARVLEMYDDPRQMIVSRLDDALSMAVEVGPVLRTLYREEMRPGSPFFGAQQARQRAQAEMVVVWWRKRYGNDIDPVAVQVLIMSVLKIAVHVCDSGNLQPGELDTIKTAARAMCLGALESVISSEQPRGDT